MVKSSLHILSQALMSTYYHSPGTFYLLLIALDNA